MDIEITNHECISIMLGLPLPLRHETVSPVISLSLSKGHQITKPRPLFAIAIILF